MFAIAARRMGYRVHCFDPGRDCPTGQVADVEINREYSDVEAARDFAAHVDVVTFEFENVPSETLEAIEAITPVHPSPHVLDTCRHRLKEKTFLKAHGIPHADWRECHNAGDVKQAVDTFGGGILKTALFGYDGKGQAKLAPGDDCSAAWDRLGQATCVVEKIVPFDREVSVIVARSTTGETRAFPPFENDHVNHILDVTTCPAHAPGAEELAIEVTDALDVVGLLAVEMFVVGDTLLVNELAPRPHNSGHLTFDACVTSQFEQQLRAVCGLPLGDPSLLCGGAAMANLLGDLWDGSEPNWAAALEDPGVKLHLYGKTEARKGRKMGHLTACAESAGEAASVVRNAREQLSVSKKDGDV